MSKLGWSEIFTVEHADTLPKLCPHCGQDLDDLSKMLEEIWLMPQLVKTTRIVVLKQSDVQVQITDGDPLRMGWRCLACNKMIAGSDFIHLKEERKPKRKPAARRPTARSVAADT